MKSLLALRVSIAWLLIAAIACGAAVIVWKLAVLDAPPSGSAFIIEQYAGGASATITPFSGGGTGDPTATADQALTTLLPATPADGESSALPHDVAPAGQPTTAVPKISVYVSGAVAKPGVYELPEGSRVNSAVEAAGGATPDADLEQINLAQKVADGDHVIVYKIGEIASAPTRAAAGAAAGPGRSGAAALPTPPAAGTPRPTPSVRINLNTATAVDLEQIPGIGPVLAQRIVADREQNGPFKSVEDLARIPGIKAGIIGRVRDFVTVGP